MKDYHEILGVPVGADKKDIKRAYFKLVREFSPEKEPERFKEIREAYECLMADDGEPKKESFVIPANPVAEKLLQQIQALVRVMDYKRAADIAKEALRMFRESEGFLYYLAMSQCRAGNTGKAVRNFERLIALYPDKILYRRELAIAYMERGYGNKAFSAFVKAFEMGCRDDEFLLMFNLCSNDRDEPEWAVEALMTLVRKEKRVLRDTMDEMLEAFMGLFMSCRFEHQIFLDVIKEFDRFIDEASAYLKEYDEEVLNIMACMLAISIVQEEKIGAEAQAVLHKLEVQIPGNELNELEHVIMQGMQNAVLDQDNRLAAVLKRGYEAFVDPDGYIAEEPQAIRFMRLDTQLCMMKEWPDIRDGVEIIRKEYPEYYEMIREFVERLERGEKLDLLRDRLLKEYDRLAANFEDGFYYKQYPEMRRSAEAVKWDSSEEGAFVRQERKIGRNEPCPCGSGKKYKNCCGKA